MALTNRYSAIDKAVITATGNTLALCGNTSEKETNTATLVKPDGTLTSEWKVAGSKAMLSVKANSTIIYAELIWYSTVYLSSPSSIDVQSETDVITFTTPAATYTDITPDYTEDYQVKKNNIITTIHRYRAAIVTNFMKTAIAANINGEYTVSHVPTSISAQGLSDTIAGWTLVVIYRNNEFVPKRITYSSGIGFTNSDNPLQTSVTGFTTPGNESNLSGRLFVACADGQPLITGESLMAGTSFATLTALGNSITTGNPKPGSSPNNPMNNIFAGQINVCNPLSSYVGLLDSSGSSSEFNHDAFVPLQVNQGRNKWDLASFDLIGALGINKNQVALQYTQSENTPGVATSGVEVVAMGSLVSAVAPNIITVLDGYDIDGDDQYNAEVGEPFTYALQIKNLGDASANNVIISTVLDTANCSFIPNSVKVNGITQTGADITKGINLGSVAPTSVLNVLYQVRIMNRPTGGLLKDSVDYSYQFISGSGSPTYTNYATTNTLEIIVEQGKLSVIKSVNKVTAKVGDTLSYTIDITNVGSQKCSRILFQDIVRNDYCTFTPNSVVVGGQPKPTYDPETGFALDPLAVGASVQISFNAIIDDLSPDTKLYNTAYVSYSYTYNQYVTPIMKTLASNTTAVQLQYYDIVAYLTNNNNYPNKGDKVTFTLQLLNIGNITSDSVWVKQDPIAGASFVAGSTIVTPGPAPTDANPFTGFYLLNNIPAKATTTVTYQVLVEEIQPNEVIQNIAQIPFKYQIQTSSPVISTEQDSNKVTTRSNFVVMNAPEVVDKGYSTIGEYLTYSVDFTNTGNIDAFNTIFYSAVQAETSFVPGSVTINGVTQSSANPNLGFSVGTISPGDTVNVKFRVLALTVPNPNVVLNQSALTYDYLPDPNGNHITTTALSNVVQTVINKASYMVVKTVDKAYAQVNDALVYTSLITNNGTVPLTNVSFIDNLPVYVKFVPGTVYIDGINYPEYDPNDGFTLMDIHPTEVYTVLFGVMVVSPPPTADISNVSHVTLSYQVNPISPTITETMYSNAALTHVMKGNADVTKYVDKNYATVGETITYTILVSNTGNTTINDVNVIDVVPSSVAHYISDTLYVNGSQDTVDNPNTGIPIGTLTQGQVATIKFSVLVDYLPTPNTITNVATANYSYYWNPTAPAVIKSTPSNPVTTVINVGSADLTKTVDKEYATIGDTLLYTILVQNTGTVSLSKITFLDTIQSDATFVTDSVLINGVVKSGYIPSTGFILEDIPAGGSQTITFQVIVDKLPSTPPSPPQINNTAKINFKYYINPYGSISTGSQTSSLATTYINQVMVTNTKIVDLSYATIDDALTYTSTIRNTGNINLTKVRFTDVVPLGTTFNAGSVVITGQTSHDTSSYNPNDGFVLDDIAPGGVVGVRFTVKVTSLPNSWECDNTSNVAYTYNINPSGADINTSITSNSVTTYIRTASVTVVKGISRTEAMQGDKIQYSFVFTNTGNTELSAITFYDPLQADSTFVTNSMVIDGAGYTYNPNTQFILPLTLKPKQVANMTFDVTVKNKPTPPVTSYILYNTATVGYQYKVNPSGSYIVVTNQSSNTTQITIKDMILQVFKEVDLDTAAIGDDITFTVTLHNAGSVDATKVRFTDLIDSHLNFTTGKVQVKVDSGSYIEYAVNPNTGFYLPVPTNGDTQTLAAGSTILVKFTATVSDRVPIDYIIRNYASISYMYTLDSVQYSVTATTNTTQTYVAAGKITATKVVDKDYATITDELMYTINVKNTGSIDANNIKLIDPVSNSTNVISGSITVDGNTTSYTASDLTSGILLTTLKPNQSHFITFKVSVTGVPSSNEVDNIAQVNYSYTINGATTSTTAYSTQATTYIKLGKLDIVKTRSMDYATIGDSILYSFTVTNSGNTNCSNIFFQDVIQSDAHYDGNGVVINGNTLYNIDPSTGFLLDSIAPGTPTMISFHVIVDTLPGNYLLYNSATASYRFYVKQDITYVISNSTSNEVYTIINVGSLYVDKGVNLAYATLNDILVYTIMVMNNGNVDAVNVNFRDVIPTGLTFNTDSVTIDGITKPGLNPYDSFSLNTLSPGQSKIVTFKTTVTSVPYPSLITNKAATTFSYRINPSGSDLFKEVDSTEATTQINLGKLSITKATDKDYVTIGNVLKYSFVITNTGNVKATNVVLTDGLQSDITFNTGTVIINSGSQTTYSPTTGIPLGTLLPNKSATVEFTVTVTMMPTHNSILNFGVGNFNYQIDPTGNTYSKSIPSNTVSTILIYPKMTSTKVVDLAYATILDTLNYTIIVTNGGNTIIKNVVLKDTLSAGAIVVPDSVYINGEQKIGYDPITGFSLPDILAGDIVNIQFAAQVTSVPAPVPQVENYAVTTGVYRIDPTGPDNNISTTTLPAVTIIHVGNVQPVKTVDMAYANVADTLVYTTVLTNTGNVDATNIWFYDNLQDELTFIQGSVTIKGDKKSTLDPTVGFLIGTLTPGQSVTVEFEAMINALPTPPQVINKAQVEFSYKIDPNGNLLTKTNFSVPAITNVVLGKLTVMKTVDLGIATLLDVLTYTIQIVNTGNVAASNVEFKDTPSTGATFVAGSVVITNGSTSSPLPLDPTVGFKLNDIPVGSTVTVGFKAKVTTMPPNKTIINQSSINFEHFVDPKDLPIHKTATSNQVTTDIEVGNITVTKAVDKLFATIGENLTYTVVVTNTGTVDVTSVMFYDQTPLNSSFVLHSVYVNGTLQATYHPALGFLIGTMKPGQIVTVVYKVQVIS